MRCSVRRPHHGAHGAGHHHRQLLHGRRDPRARRRAQPRAAGRRQRHRHRRALLPGEEHQQLAASSISTRRRTSRKWSTRPLPGLLLAGDHLVRLPISAPVCTTIALLAPPHRRCSWCGRTWRRWSQTRGACPPAGTPLPTNRSAALAAHHTAPQGHDAARVLADALVMVVCVPMWTRVCAHLRGAAQQARHELDRMAYADYYFDRRDPRRPRFCKRCQAWKPERAHHCSVMGRCVLKMGETPLRGGVGKRGGSETRRQRKFAAVTFVFAAIACALCPAVYACADHYCIWVVNCIGLMNYKVGGRTVEALAVHPRVPCSSGPHAHWRCAHAARPPARPPRSSSCSSSCTPSWRASW